jgi:hypothetical protein
MPASGQVPGWLRLLPLLLLRLWLWLWLLGLWLCVDAPRHKRADGR